MVLPFIVITSFDRIANDCVVIGLQTCVVVEVCDSLVARAILSAVFLIDAVIDGMSGHVRSLSFNKFVRALRVV